MFSDADGDGEVSIIDEDNEVMQEVHYYPFGMNYDNSPSSPWYKYANPEKDEKLQYNGKEVQDESFLTLEGKEIGLGWLDYGARYYDPSSGRFTSIDRFCEKFAFQSGFVYAQNDPIRYIEINGDSIPSLKTYVNEVIVGAAKEGYSALKTIGGAVSNSVGGALSNLLSFDVEGSGTNQITGALLNTEKEGARAEGRNYSDMGPKESINIDGLVTVSGKIRNKNKNIIFAIGKTRKSPVVKGVSKMSQSTSKIASVKSNGKILQNASGKVFNIYNAKRDTILKIETNEQGDTTYMRHESLKPKA